MRRLRHLRIVVLRVPRRKAPALVARLARTRSVATVERDRVVMRITALQVAQETPTDPLWGQQWGPALIQAPTAWAVTKGSANVVVAVLDTGVDFSQPDLQGAFVAGHDFVNNDSDPSDDHGHGTEVAGIIAARADNGLGGAGLCPECSIMPVKVVGADGSAGEANVAAGIAWATDHGARVINVSLGGSYGATVSQAVDYARSKGVLIVAAAGNNGNSNLFYPAADPGVLSVAASQPSDQLYSWSNYGSWVDVAAPGCDLTTLRGGQYAEACGTSAATPVVSGLAALALSYSPSTSAAQVEQAITSGGQSVAGVSHGRVDVAGTLAALGAKFAAVPPAGGPAPPASLPASPAAPLPLAANLAGSAQTRKAVPGRRVVRVAPQPRRRARRAPQAARRHRVELFRRSH